MDFPPCLVIYSYITNHLKTSSFKQYKFVSSKSLWIRDLLFISGSAVSQKVAIKMLERTTIPRQLCRDWRICLKGGPVTELLAGKLHASPGIGGRPQFLPVGIFLQGYSSVLMACQLTFPRVIKKVQGRKSECLLWPGLQNPAPSFLYSFWLYKSVSSSMGGAFLS